ncbi:MAG: hypothetical protein GY928_23190 [Colwellia sp.]|nr:hypothetical protein [Colwellia sp.]
MKLKPKQKVKLSPESLYARPQFQREGKGHLKLDAVGTIVKAHTDMEEGWYTVKFKDNGSEKTTQYIEGMLIRV